jgi:hypothetical protein
MTTTHITVPFKNCKLVLSQKLCDYTNSWKPIIYFEKPGNEKIEVDAEDLSVILNSLMECQDTLTSHAIVDSSCQLIKIGRTSEDPEIYLLTTKINDKIRISLLGFLISDGVKQKHFEIKFDKSDDIFHACGECLRFVSQTKTCKIGLMLL